MRFITSATYGRLQSSTLDGSVLVGRALRILSLRPSGMSGCLVFLSMIDAISYVAGLVGVGY